MTRLNTSVRLESFGPGLIAMIKVLYRDIKCTEDEWRALFRAVILNHRVVPPRGPRKTFYLYLQLQYAEKRLQLSMSVRERHGKVF